MKINICIFFILFCSFASNAQVVPGKPTVQTFISGYGSSISGEIAEMQSGNPYVTRSLISRCTGNSSNNTIAWKTAAVPADFKENYVYIVWVAGLSTGRNRHNSSYHLYINDGEGIPFRIKPGSFPPEQKLFSNSATELSFVKHYVDANEDCFGLMYLKVPVSSDMKGRSINLKVVADNSNRYDDWYMAFLSEVKEVARVSARPLLMRHDGKLMQEIMVEVDHVLPGQQECVISVGKNPVVRKQVLPGYNRIGCWVPAVFSLKKMDCKVEIPGVFSFEKEITVGPVHKRDVYLIPCSHTDVGYSNLQDTVAKQHVEYIRMAMRIIGASLSNPWDAQFKWNVESLWAANNFMKVATDKEKDQFIDYVKKGYIGLSAGYVNLLTGVSGPEEMTHWTAYSDTLRRKYNIPFRSLMSSDVPGMSWNVVAALAQRKIRYVSNGPNYIPHEGFPDFGGRVGSTHRAQGDRPFYWVSPSGEDTVLFWQAGKGYSWFQDWNVGRFGTLKSEDSLLNYMNELDHKKYPYDMVQLRYSVINDNCPPDANLPEFVRGWNQKYESPKLVITTVDSMMVRFERKYRKAIPVHEGDFTPYWEDGAMSTAREETLARASTDRLIQSSIVHTLFYHDYDAPKYADAWKNLVMWHEHTWGAWNSISNPDDAYAVKEWLYKQQFALCADSLSRELFQTSAEANGSAGSQFYVINPASFDRSEIVILSKEQSSFGNIVTDENGRPCPSQRLTDERLAFLASGVPALGYKQFTVVKGDNNYASALKVTKDGLENDDLAISIDTVTGAIRSLRSRKEKKEFVNSAVLRGLNQYLYVPGLDPSAAQTVKNPLITVKERGPLIATIEVQSQAPGTNGLTQEISLINGLNEVRITNTIDKLKNRRKESVHFAFPVKMADGQIRYGIGGGVVRPEADQLKGANKDYSYVHKWVDVSDPSGGILFMEKDAPLIEAGALINEIPQKISNSFGGVSGEKKWKDTVTPSTTFFSYVMNNYWYTNYKADQEGIATFNYSLKLHQRFDQAFANRQSLGYSQPLLVATNKPAFTLPFILKDSSILLTSARPSIDGKGIVIRLYNSSAFPCRLNFHWTKDEMNRRQRKVYLVDESEDKPKPFDLHTLWPANSIKTLLIE